MERQRKCYDLANIGAKVVENEHLFAAVGKQVFICNKCNNYRGNTNSLLSDSTISEQTIAKGAFHRRRSNLGSAEPGSIFIINFNQVEIYDDRDMIGCTNVKLRSADVVQLNHDFELWLNVLDADWSDLIEISGVTNTVHKRKLVLLRGQPPVASIFSLLSTMFFLARIFLIVPPSHQRNLRVVI